MTAQTFSQGRRLKFILLGCIALLVFSSIGLSIYAKSVYDGNFPRVDSPKYTALLRYGDVNGVDHRVMQFRSAENFLTAYLYGEENRKGLVIISHGLGYGAEDYLAQTMYFVDHGWRVFTFDNTGTYASQGKNTKGLPQSAMDLEAALTFIQNDPGLKDLPVMLFGHSWGGYAVTAILNGSHPVAAVVSLAGFYSPEELLREQAGQMGWLGSLSYPFLAGYQSWLFGDKTRLTAVDGINKSNIPVMIIHGTADADILFNGASIISHKNLITNPKVVFKTASAENRNSHRDLWRSDAAITYILQINQEYKTLFDRYDGKIPDEMKAQFYAGLDKRLVNELDADFMGEINDFFERQLH